MEWETVIGLEVHVQLATQSKIFSGAPTTYGATPNTQACAIDLGMPGVLPVLNKEVVRLALLFGLSIDAEITRRSIFARKNYFYPDLPKGYQISQFEYPIVGVGQLDITLEDGTEKRIGVTRAHLEEDAGKSLHEDIKNSTGVDLNRAGTPLLEIVSEPDMRSAKEAIAYLKTLHTLVRYLGISDGNMAEGSFRCDANISIRPKGQKEFGTRAEIKNVNSFRFVERAINYEVDRQKEILEDGGKITQETRLYDSNKDVTRSMRSKEEAMDYRYFPDPDLLPLVVSEEEIEALRQILPELPQAKKERFKIDYQLKDYDTKVLTADLDVANYFEATAKHLKQAPAKLAANWINGDLAAALNKHHLTIDKSPVNSEMLAQLLERIADNTISGSAAKTVFEALWAGETDVDKIIGSHDLKQNNDTDALAKIIDEIIENNPEQAEQYRGGKDKLMAFFVGQTMKATRGKANPQQVNALLKEKLG